MPQDCWSYLRSGSSCRRSSNFSGMSSCGEGPERIKGLAVRHINSLHLFSCANVGRHERSRSMSALIQLLGEVTCVAEVARLPKPQVNSSTP